jgi:hypothetical protein
MQLGKVLTVWYGMLPAAWWVQQRIKANITAFAHPNSILFDVILKQASCLSAVAFMALLSLW